MCTVLDQLCGSEFTVRLATAPASAELPRFDRQIPPSATRSHDAVLIVDDSVDAANSLATLLAFEGHETHKAHDGADAVRTAEHVRPDVVLMDIGLPVLNGYEACRRIRSYAWGAPIIMVAITGWGQEEDREQSNAAGFDRHLVKPVDHDELLRVVGSARPRASA